jgi:hypothetical protein
MDLSEEENKIFFYLFTKIQYVQGYLQKTIVKNIQKNVYKNKTTFYLYLYIFCFYLHLYICAFPGSGNHWLPVCQVSMPANIIGTGQVSGLVGLNKI